MRVRTTLSSSPSSSSYYLTQVRLKCFWVDEEGAEIEYGSSGTADHHHQMPEQNIGGKEKTKRIAADPLRWQKQAGPELFLRIQKYPNSADLAQPIKRLKARGDN